MRKIEQQEAIRRVDNTKGDMACTYPSLAAAMHRTLLLRPSRLHAVTCSDIALQVYAHACGSTPAARAMSVNGLPERVAVQTLSGRSALNRANSEAR